MEVVFLVLVFGQTTLKFLLRFGNRRATRFLCTYDSNAFVCAYDVAPKRGRREDTVILCTLILHLPPNTNRKNNRMSKTQNNILAKKILIKATTKINYFANPNFGLRQCRHRVYYYYY